VVIIDHISAWPELPAPIISKESIASLSPPATVKALHGRLGVGAVVPLAARFGIPRTLF